MSYHVNYRDPLLNILGEELELRPSFELPRTSSAQSSSEGIALRQRAMVGLIPDLGHPAKYVKKECDCYWDYSQLDPSLMEYVKKLPKEIRERVYEYIAMPWAPLDPYPVTDVLTDHRNSTGLARRNKSPLFVNGNYQKRCHIAAGRLALRRVEATRDGDASSFYELLSRRLADSATTSWHVSNGTSRAVKSMFRERFGLLDYFKESEHQNIIEFAKALERYEGHQDKQSINHGVKARSDTTDFYLVHDFLDWFWETTVLDLKYGWLLPPYQEDPARKSLWKSSTWLRLRPDYHARIRNICIFVGLDPPEDTKHGDAHRIGDEQLSNACMYLSGHLVNLKSILLFIQAPTSSIDHLLGETINHSFARTIRQLSAADRFEVRFGVYGYIKDEERQIEGNEKHLMAEKAVEMLLMPDGLWEKEQSSQRSQAMIVGEQKAFAFETVASMGWMTLESADGVEHNIGNFLYVQ
ncbi:hypothetical protein EG329_004183 [Mollisiaceae sp. DMI_Dod_QoI]|nr:hypothetical protein EG329_004183 [Helotiales sp. DMI_Dod_QoI]